MVIRLSRMVVRDMAKKNFSNKGISTKAVSKKVVVDKEKSTEKITQKNEVKEVQNTTRKLASKNEPKKVVKEKEMDNFMSEDKVSIKEVAFKIWDVVFWVLFAILACVWIVDFFRVKAEKQPMFCINKETIEFEDGNVDKCVGLGYTVYDYDRESLDSGIQFGPFFMKMKEPSAE